MVKRNVKEVIYFILLFILFYLGVQTTNLWVNHAKVYAKTASLIVGIVFTLVMVALYYLAGLNNKTSEKFWDVSAGAKCRGGPYMWQGDSEQAKTCREMAKTPQGRAEIAAYSCPTGFEGIPKRPFKHTTISNDKWENERCM